MSFTYISLEEILRLHFQLIEDFGGSHGVRDENRLKSVVEAPKQNKKVNAKPKDLEVFIVRVATDHLDVQEIAVWLESHTI